MLVASLVISACGQREDPARVELRSRLKQDARLSNEDLGRELDEVSRTLAGKTVRFKQDSVTGTLNEEQRSVVLGMLTDRAGVYDEGVRTTGGATLRVINAPGRSLNSEYEATRRLLVDAETFLPRRFEFTYGVSGLGDYSFDLLIDQ
jgi:hypothetical protein